MKPRLANTLEELNGERIKSTKMISLYQNGLNQQRARADGLVVQQVFLVTCSSIQCRGFVFIPEIFLPFCRVFFKL